MRVNAEIFFATMSQLYHSTGRVALSGREISERRSLRGCSHEGVPVNIEQDSKPIVYTRKLTKGILDLEDVLL